MLVPLLAGNTYFRGEEVAPIPFLTEEPKERYDRVYYVILRHLVYILICRLLFISVP